MDADVLLISPDSLYPRGQWISFTNSDGGCYNVDASRTYKQRVAFLKKEVDDCLNAGKNVFVLATKEEEYQLAGGVSSLRKGEHTYQTERYSNYNFLPISIGDLTSASGRHIEFSGNTIFSDFYEKFKDNLEYHLYIENPQNSQIIFTGKDKTKVLGTVYKVKNGHLVVLPYVKYDEKKFITYNKKEDKSYWTADAIKFGKILTKAFIDIDKALRSVEDKTPPPNWINNPPFLIEKEEKLKEAINENDKKIASLALKNKELQTEVASEAELKDLLFEQGKPLESAVIRALEILGFKAENYNDGTVELDQVILGPEGIRCIGESEGKDNKDINIDKIRQLIESLNADSFREEVSEKATGILFGNPQRLVDPQKRTLDFTEKCKKTAEREKIALVKTADLFSVAKYLKENENEEFKKACREALYNGLGKIVIFPSIP
jgi:hypothetical protein